MRDALERCFASAMPVRAHEVNRAPRLRTGLDDAPPRSWIALVVTDVPHVRCEVCDLRLYDAEVEAHLDRLVVAYWDEGAERGGDLTVSYQPPQGADWNDPIDG